MKRIIRKNSKEYKLKILLDKEVSQKIKLREEVEVLKNKNSEEYKMYSKNFHELRRNKNFWIWTMSIISILLLISLGIAQNRLVAEEQFSYLITVAGVNANMELNNCRASLKNVTQKYNDNFYEVISNKPMQGIFDCCWPLDCAEAINNPAECSCEYNIKCSGWTYGANN